MGEAQFMPAWHAVSQEWMHRRWRIGRHDCIHLCADWAAQFGPAIDCPEYAHPNDLTVWAMLAAFGRPCGHALGNIYLAAGPELGISVGYSVATFSSASGLVRQLPPARALWWDPSRRQGQCPR